jgi:hypothetical protein
MSAHEPMRCDDPDCSGRCFLCQCFACKVCGGVEGSLTTECPGERCSGIVLDRVYHGQTDYVNGMWIMGSVAWRRAQEDSSDGT